MDCIPYAICFTDARFNSSGELIDKITGRPYRFDFTLSEMELDVPYISDSSHWNKARCWHALRWVRINYGDESNIQMFKHAISYICEEEQNGKIDRDSAREAIRCIMDDEIYCFFSQNHSHEREARLIFYVPVNISDYPQIRRSFDRDSTDDKHIYLRFRRNKDGIQIEINPRIKTSVKLLTLESGFTKSTVQM